MMICYYYNDDQALQMKAGDNRLASARYAATARYCLLLPATACYDATAC